MDPRLTGRPAVHRGVTRTVLLIGPWAVKVPSLGGWGARGPLLAGRLWSWTCGVQANLSELEWSTQPGVCPVRWSLAGLVNVYPRCEPVPAGAAVDYDRIGFPGPGQDRKPANVGYLHGRLVWLDYDQSAGNCQACRRYTYQEGHR